MAVDVAVASPRTARFGLLARAIAVPARLWLAGIVVASFGVRWAAALAHVTPFYLPDEYIYPALARGLAASGRPLIRGEVAHFPALLEPMLAAPFWLTGDPVLAYRLTQGLHALAMSLAAVPVYLLARRLRLGTGLALGSAALAVASPSLFYASFMLADPVAYPLALAAVYAGVCALERPTRRAQLAFVAFSGLATLGRLQYVVLPFAFVCAGLIVERGHVLRLARRLWLSLALFVVPALGLAVLGLHRVLGTYSSITQARPHQTTLLHWVGSDLMLLAYSSGWVIVPGALVGLGLAIVRPRARVERAFAALAVMLAGGLLAEAAWVAGLDSSRFQERYLIALLPLVAPAFGLYLKRGRPGRLVIALSATGMLVLSVRVPLSGYAAVHGKDDSPLLSGLTRFEQLVGTANGAFALALGAALLSVAAVAVAFRTRGGAAVALGLAIAATTAVSVGAYSFDRVNSHNVRTVFLARDVRWVDHTGLRDVAILQPPGAQAGRAHDQLIWNRSITKVLLLGRTPAIDPFQSSSVDVAADGALLEDGQPVRRPLLVQTYSAVADFDGAVAVARGPAFELWRPVGIPRLRLLAVGRYFDRWLSRAGEITIWPEADGRVRGRLTLPLRLPHDARPTPLRFEAPGVARRVVLTPGRRRVISFQVDERGPWTLRFRTSKPGLLSDGRLVSTRAGKPSFTPAVGSATPRDCFDRPQVAYFPAATSRA